jgi:hypothetical protein
MFLREADSTHFYVVKTCALAMMTCSWMRCGGKDDFLLSREIREVSLGCEDFVRDDIDWCKEVFT